VQALQSAYPADWQSVLEVAQRQPAMTLRVNPRLQSRTDYQAALAACGLRCTAPDDPLLDQALILKQAVAVERLPGFERAG
jgi:hypothetical protein